MPSWPASLPEKPQIEGYRETAPELKLRTKMDAGPPEMRRRFTGGIRLFEFEMILTSAQVSTLDAFHDTDTKGGSLSFSWTFPRTGASCTARFVDEPEYRAIGGEYYRVGLNFEILP